MAELKIKRAPTTEANQRAWEQVYDDINDIINAVNKKSEVENREGSQGDDGDIRLFKDVDKGKYFIEGKFRDGWAKRELLFSDNDDATQDESINFSATESYVKPDGSVPFTSVQTGVAPTNTNHLSTKGYVDDNTLASVTKLGGTNNVKFGFSDTSNDITFTSFGSNAFNSTAFLTGNEAITISGDVSGTGATSITTTIGANKIKDSMIDFGTGTNQVSSDDVPEGSTNFYASNERIDDRVNALITDGTGIGTLYDDAANTLTLNVTLSGLNTGDLSEGSNLYHTTARVRQAISGQNDISYNNSTGVISFTDAVTGGANTLSDTTDKKGVFKNLSTKNLNFYMLKAGSNITLTKNNGGGQADTYIEIAAASTTVSNANWSGVSLSIQNGGTGASSASGARTALGVDAAGTDNSTNVSLSGSYDYITISGQTITRNQINLNTDVTGSLSDSYISSASTWNGKLDSILSLTGGTGTVSIVSNGNDNNVGKIRNIKGTGTVTTTVHNDGYLEIAGGTGTINLASGVTGTLPAGNGGTGVTSINALKTTLGLGSAAYTDSSAYATSSQITTINNSLATKATISGSTANGIMTYNSGVQLDVEADLTYTGGTLIVNKTGNSDGKIRIEADSSNSNENHNPYLIFSQDGNEDQSAVYMNSNQLIIANSATSSGGISVRTTSSSVDYSTATERILIESDGDVLPGVNNTQELGSSSKRWEKVYATTYNAAGINGLTAVKTFSIGSNNHTVTIKGGIITSWDIFQ